VPSWVWTFAFGAFAAGAYWLWADTVDPWLQQLSNAGFGGTDFVSLAFFQRRILGRMEFHDSRLANRSIGHRSNYGNRPASEAVSASHGDRGDDVRKWRWP